jgi:DNA-binding LacI/PurR family transcriptional regulator
MIDDKNYIPAFKQLKDILLDRIQKTKPDTKIDSIRDLRKEFNISQATVDRTLYELEQEGLIYKVQGKGTFVADRKTSEPVRKGTIALIIPQINFSTFFSNIAQGVENEAFKLGYQMIVCSSYENISREKEYIKRLLQNNTEGIIYASSASEPDEYLHIDEIASKIPLTVIDVALKNVNCDYVTTDDEAGAFDAISHFISQGHKRIAIMTTPTSKEISTMSKRLEGYKKALEAHGIAVDSDLILTSEHCDFEHGYRAMDRALRSKFDATALFCASDNLGTGALQALYDHNVKIPDEISVIGYGNLKLDNPYKLTMSTVVQPTMEMGKKAVELLNEKFEKKRPLFSYKEVILPVKLEINET